LADIYISTIPFKQVSEGPYMNVPAFYWTIAIA